MANTVNITLKAKTEGLNEANEVAKSLNKNMTQAAGAAKKLSGTKIAAAAYKGAQSAQESVDYGVARSLRPGGTGASARDFAQEAQGLGGLVRLYATYAANIFAVGAAFRALSSAMDTSNMVKGLDQLGAASGTALGNLSKRLAAATDGAISLREAMEATAKASSSGMSSDQILRMGNVAKQASQALGVDMSDAISRISRGITKLEPELLDELGLFTKTGKAAEDYAKSVGKTVTELTDFERRAAFANAVLAEGEKKFGAIKLDTNPYTKLIASIKDLAQTGLEVVNKVLGPLVEYLSSSPKALGIALAGLGAILVKQALPAIGEFKAGLASAADKATQLSVQKAKDAATARKAIDAQILSQVEALADDKVAAVDAAEQKIAAIEKSRISKSSAAYKLLQKDIHDVTEADITGVEKRAKIVESSGDTQRAQAYRDVAQAVREHKKAEEDLIVTKQKLSAQLEKDARSMTTYGLTVRAAEKAQIAAAKANMISNAAYNGSLIGTTGAMTLLRAELERSGISMSRFGTRVLLTRGYLAALGGQISTVMASLGPIMLIITALTMAFSFLDGILSGNTKEIGEFGSALTAADESAANFTRTIEAINKNPIEERLSITAINAIANAFEETSNNVTSLTNSLLSADKAATGWDRFFDAIKGLWNGDLASKFAKGASTSIFGTLDGLAGSPEAAKVRQEISKILEIDPNFTKETLDKALENTAKTAKEKLPQVEAAIKNIGTAMKVSAAKGTELVESLKKSAEMRTAIEKSFMPSDQFTKYGQQLMDDFTKLSIALDDPTQKLNAIQQLATEMLNLPGTGLSDALGMKEVAKDAKDLQVAMAKELEIAKKQIDTEKELAELIGSTSDARRVAQGKEIQVGGLLNRDGIKEFYRLKEELASLRAEGDVNIKVKAELSGKIEAATAQIEKAQLSVFTTGADIVAKQLNAEWAKAGTTISNAYASILSGTEEGIRMRADADKAVISAQIEQIKSQRELVIATRELAVQMKRDEIERAKMSTSWPEFERTKGPQQLAELDRMEADLRLARSGDVKGASKARLAEYTSGGAKLSEMAADSIKFLQNMEASAAAIANLGAQAKAVDIRKIDEEVTLEYKKRKDALDVELKQLETRKQGLELQRSILGEANQVYIAKKQEFETDALRIKQASEMLSIEGMLARYRKVPKGMADKAIAEEERKKQQLAINQLVERENLLKTQNIEKVDSHYKTLIKEQQNYIEKENLSRAIADDRLKAELDVLEAKKSAGIVSDATYLASKKELDDLRIKLDYENQIASIRQQYSPKLLDLSRQEESIKASTTVDPTTGMYSYTPEQQAAIAEIAAETARINSLMDEGRTKAEQQRDVALQIQAITQKTAEDQLRWNEAFAAMEGIAQALVATFGEVGDAVGGFGKSLLDFAKQDETNAASRAESSKKLLDIQKQIADVEESGDSASMKLLNEESKARDQVAKADKKSKLDELKGIQNIASAGKKMFGEKTAAHKAFAALEKATAMASMAIQAQEMATTLAGLPAKIAGGVGKLFDQGGWAGFAGAAAFLALMASLGFGGGGGVSTVGMTAEDVQKVQGTGQDWVNGELVDNGGGVLGDITAKSEDIANSLSIIEDNTTSQILFDSKAADYLRLIESNTKGLAAAIYRAEGISVGTGFGTQEGKDPGFLGAFATSTEIIDSGIKAVGKLGEILKDPKGFFQQYETVKETDSGLWGLFSSEEIKVNTKPLEVELAKYITSIFENAQKAIVDLGTIFGMNTTEAVNSLVESLNVEFQVSARGLKGDELIEAIMAETGVTMNQLTAQVYPFLEQFQQVGEGMLTTLTRVNTDIQVVNGMFAQMGVDFAASFTPGMELVKNASTEASRAVVAEAKVRADAAKAAVERYDEGDFAQEEYWSGGDQAYMMRDVPLAATEAELKELRLATEAYNEALKAENNLKYANISATIATYEALVESEGGLDRFTERAQFFLDNFVPQSVKLDALSTTISDSFDRLNENLGAKLKEGSGLWGLFADETIGKSSEEIRIAIPKTREEFYNLVSSLDLTTEAGREAYSSLMDVAPAFEELQSAIDSMMSSAGMSASTLADKITSGLMDGVDGSEIGKMIANTVQRGTYQALISGVSDNISQLISSQILNPMMTSIITSGTIVGTVSEATIQKVVEQASSMIQALAQVLNSPEFQSLITQLGSLANINFSGISVPAAYKYPEDNKKSAEDAAKKAADDAKKAADDAKKEMSDAFNALKKAVDAEKKILNEQLKTAQDLLSELTKAFDILTDNIKSLRNEVISTAKLSAQEAQQYLNTILQTGVIGEADKLSEAIDSVRASMDEGNYASKFESDRDRLILAGQLSAIKLLTKGQMTDAEYQIEALNTQIDRLDTMIEQYQTQIDAVNGVDTSVKTVAQAIRALDAAIVAAAKANQTGIPTSSPGVAYLTGGQYDPNAQIRHMLWNEREQRMYYGQDKARGDVGRGYIDASDLIARSEGGTSHAVTKEDFDKWKANLYRVGWVTQYANGGIFSNSIVTEPTIFDASVMGEAGPEAIMPLSRGADGSLGVTVRNNGQEAVAAELKELRKQNEISEKQIAYLMSKVATSTEETRRLLDEVVRGGEPITVNSEIGTY